MLFLYDLVAICIAVILGSYRNGDTERILQLSVALLWVRIFRRTAIQGMLIPYSRGSADNHRKQEPTIPSKRESDGIRCGMSFFK